MKILLLVLFFTMQSHAAINEFTTLINSAANSRLSMNLRWGALIKAAQLADIDQLERVRQFSGNKEWYMRNAALVALSQVSPVIALAEAKKLLYDKSLVVRSAAVEIIADNLNAENKNILVEEMSKAYNFNKKSSLWIRKQIVEKLSISAGSIDRDFFVRSLFDSDKEIARMSAKMLSKITGERIEGTNLVEKWQILVKQNNWL